MKIMPVKFIVGLSIICLIIFPILFYIVSFLLFYILSIGNSIVPYYVIFIIMAFGIIIEFSPQITKEVISLPSFSTLVAFATPTTASAPAETFTSSLLSA